MSSSPNSVGLGDVQASLSFFAEAMAGEPVVFETLDQTDDDAACWPDIASSPDSAVVRVPSESPSRQHYRAIVLQQVLVQPSPLRPPPEFRTMFRNVYGLVEDHRIHALTHRLFPGAADQLRAMLYAAASTLEPSDAFLVELRRYSLAGALDDLDHELNALVVIMNRVASPGATALTSATVAVQLCAIIEGLQQGRLLEDLLAHLEASDEDPALPSDGPTSVSLDGGAPSEFVETDGLGGGQLLGDGDEMVPTAESSETDEDAPGLGLQLPWTGRDATIAAESRTYVYDEWDYHAQQHRPSWCRVIEEQLIGDDHGFITDVRARHQALRSRIRRSLMRLKTEDLVRVYRADDGEELDLDAVIEAMADRRGGAPADERLNIRRDRAARDVATAFLVDLSASTSSPAVPPEPEPIPETDPMDDPMSYGPIWDTPARKEPVRRVIDVAKDAVALMGDALHELGDRYAIYGFSGTGREAVEFKIGKDFKDRVSSTSWAAVAEMKPLRYTRMGPAVRHAASKLAAESARTKLLIVVSDGYPQDTDYGNDRHDREYGIQDTARALADANNAGIETFCVTIDPAGHDYLRTMCPDHRYLVIEDVESLPEALANVYVGRFHTAGRVESLLGTQH